ncbi:STAS domain-containing protein [uncultured Thalassolituus sp.]|uniref:STAS domain-containing protein n=1 Tax=uncultured Thalassolituus sp. TaxID=285273 RepID=UPI002626B031|nr:STAS domain-containing protein [uncultured Thalassolituus sp.]
MTEAATIHCGNRLSIDQVEGLYQKLEAAVLSGGDLTLDAGDVHFCDTAGLQMILSLRKTLAGTGNDISWSAVTDVLKDTAGYLGIRKSLNLPE